MPRETATNPEQQYADLDAMITSLKLTAHQCLLGIARQSHVESLVGSLDTMARTPQQKRHVRIELEKMVTEMSRFGDSASAFEIAVAENTGDLMEARRLSGKTKSIGRKGIRLRDETVQYLQDAIDTKFILKDE